MANFTAMSRCLLTILCWTSPLLLAAALASESDAWVLLLSCSLAMRRLHRTGKSWHATKIGSQLACGLLGFFCACTSTPSIWFMRTHRVGHLFASALDRRGERRSERTRGTIGP